MSGPPKGFQRSKTTTIDKNSVDFMVLQFSCVDNTVLSRIGKHSKETRWVIAVGLNAEPIDITVTVDKAVAMDPEVGVKCRDEQLYPDPKVTGKGDLKKAKLSTDFYWQLPFRGKVQGLNVDDYFEVRPEHISSEVWYTATLVEQREDGLFKANVIVPDAAGGKNHVKTVVYPAVKPENIREAAGTRKPLQMPKRSLVLMVPKADPLHATLAIDGKELITHFFARPTPYLKPPAEDKLQVTAELNRPKVSFSVTKDRKQVTTSAGHSYLAHFLKGEVRAVSQTCDTKKHTWTIQIGPCAEHVIELEKKYKSSNVVTLSVDGAVLVEATSEDIESPDTYWLCPFRLIGERSLEWEVNESDGNGRTLESRGIVSQVSKYQHECNVYFTESIKDLTEARLNIDGLDFVDLTGAKEARKEDSLTMQPEALQGSYGLTVPYKHHDANTKKETDAKKGGGGGGGFFASCCGDSRADAKNELEVGNAPK